ncbi:MAG: hypothetical protein IJT25_00110 [Clostridia bacterium]|nr:hypothetical protein [Clostridia bacterium]
MEEQLVKEHKVEMVSRKLLTISGVQEVISSQDNLVSIKTVCSAMQISGNSLRIAKLDLDKGLLEIEGNLSGIKYLGSSTKKSFFARIFK